MRCGIATCSIYLTERATRWLADVGPAAFSALGWCPAWCGRALALAGAFVTLKARQARDDSNCLRFRYVPIWPPGVVGVYNTPSDHVWCRNDWRTT